MKKLKRLFALLLVCAVFSMFFPAFSDAKEEDSLSVSEDGIQIDGYYDDWTGFPDTDLTYYANNKLCVNKGNIYSDGDYLYVHIKMNSLYQSQMSIQSFVLKVNDKETAIPILGVKEDGSIDWNVPIYGGMTEGVHTNLAVFLGYYTSCDSSVAFTVYDVNHSSDTEGDEIEFRISMADITKYFGIDADSINTISVRNPNIGGEAVMYAGSSTGPVALVVVGFLLATGAVAACEYKKRKRNAVI